MTRCLIIGCGYVGNHLGTLLLNEGCTVYGLRRQAHKIAENITPIGMDWLDMTVDKLPEVDFIFYLLSPDSSDDTNYKKTYLEGTKHLIHLLNTSEKPCQKIIYASSTKVYSIQDGSWVDEETPINPTEPKAKILYEAENIITSSGHDFSIARLGGIYGPHRHFLLNQVINGEVSIRKDQAFSNRIHQEDCAQALKHMMTLTFNEGIYNVVDQEPATLNTIISWISSKSGKPLPPLEEANSSMDLRLTNKQCSCQRLLHTGFIFKYPNFRDGFGEILRKEFNVH
ncbi:MAG TPA: NAD-dependent epimerase/dehydratase family protein [Gammaproteobacteria bacterium]|nr:NAD-dependent epimerase/dehydratase family protein [Gammaproteobacteria bacterium]